MSLTNAAAFAGANDYTFESVAPEWKKGDDVVVAVRLTHTPRRQAGGRRGDLRTRVDMAPTTWPTWCRRWRRRPSKEPGVYAFKTRSADGRTLSVQHRAKVQGEPETVVGKINPQKPVK